MLRLTESNLAAFLLRSITCLAIFTTLAGAAVPKQGGIPTLRGMAIAPVMFRATGTAGALVPQLTIEIQNLDERPSPTRLTIHAVQYADWAYGPKMDVKTKFDCSDWFETKVYTKTIGATSTAKIPLKCLVPRGTPTGVYYCLGTIAPVEDPSKPAETHAEYQIPIIIRVGPIQKPNLQFGSPVLDQTEKLTTVTVPFINDGDAFAIIGVTVQVRNAVTGALLQTVNDSDHNLYPQSKRNLILKIDHVPDGQYIVQASCQVFLQTYRPISSNYVVNKGKAAISSDLTIKALPRFTMETTTPAVTMPKGGNTRMVSVKITNQTATPLTLSITRHRLGQDINGLLQVLDTAPMAPLTVELTPETLELPARGVGLVHARVTVAPGAVGDSWFAISALSTAKDTLSYDLPIDVVVDKTGVYGLSIVPKEITKSAEGIPIDIDYEVTNTGNTALIPLITAAVMEQGLTAVAKLEVPSLGYGEILPGATLHNRLQLPLHLKPGAYTVRLEYQYAEGKSKEPISEIKQLPFYIPGSKPPAAPKKSKSGGSP